MKKILPQSKKVVALNNVFHDRGKRGTQKERRAKRPKGEKEMVREALEEVTNRGEKTMYVLPTDMKTYSEQFGESKAE